MCLMLHGETRFYGLTLLCCRAYPLTPTSNHFALWQKDHGSFLALASCRQRLYVCLIFYSKLILTTVVRHPILNIIAERMKKAMKLDVNYSDYFKVGVKLCFFSCWIWAFFFTFGLQLTQEFIKVVLLSSVAIQFAISAIYHADCFLLYRRKTRAGYATNYYAGSAFRNFISCTIVSALTSIYLYFYVINNNF